MVAELEHVVRQLRHGRAGPGVPAGLPARVLDEDQRALHLGEAAEHEARVHREPDRLLQRGGREVEVEQSVGIAAVAVQVPLAGVVKVEAAELEPGPAVVGSGGEIAAEEVDGHLPLALRAPEPRPAGRRCGSMAAWARRAAGRRAVASQGPGTGATQVAPPMADRRVHEAPKMTAPGPLG